MGQADQAVSVVMPVRNAMPFLDDAIISILAQTHDNFELVIGDDGSTDGSSGRIDEWARRDKRIRVIRNQGAGLGPAGSANWVARAAIHPLIARMDADDISMPERLRAQVQALCAEPAAVIVGSLYDYIDRSGRRIGGRDRSVFRNGRCVFPISHGSMMIRREAFERVGGYRPECDYWEDVDLFLRLGRQGRVLILPEVHYRYRYSPTSSRQVSNEAMVTRALDLSVRCLAAHCQGRDYDPLIEENLRSEPRNSVSLSVLAQVALERLWRGNPRSIFRSWAWRHASFSESRRNRTLILIFAAWAWLNPASLRTLLSLRIGLADWRARHIAPDGIVHTWPTAWQVETNVRPLHRESAAPRAHESLFEEVLSAPDGRLVANAGPQGFLESV
ncbi:MAG TPA: glycosyltransferase family A protein [Allosphingosinicella sp.]